MEMEEESKHLIIHESSTPISTPTHLPLDRWFCIFRDHFISTKEGGREEQEKRKINIEPSSIDSHFTPLPSIQIMWPILQYNVDIQRIRECDESETARSSALVVFHDNTIDNFTVALEETLQILLCRFPR